MATASDDFNRADDPTGLGANWTLASGGSPPHIVSNKANVTTPGSDCQGEWTPTTFGLDQFAQVDVTVSGTSSGDAGLGLMLRKDPAASTFYRIVVDHALPANSNCGVSKIVSGVYTNISNPLIGAWTDGSTLRVEVTGTNPTTIRVYMAGVLVATVIDSTSPITSPTTTRAGLFFSSSETSASWDNWGAGDLVLAKPFIPHRMPLAA